MAGVWQRHVSKFVSIDGATAVDFTTFATGGGLMTYQWADQQPLRTAFQNLVGADYGFDLIGAGAAPKANAKEVITVLVSQATGLAVDTSFETMRSNLRKIGQGKLYTIDDSAVLRWAYARPTAMPKVTITNNNRITTMVQLEFERMSDWFANALTTVTTSITSNGQTFVLTNNGNAPVRFIEFVVKGPTYNHPKLTNQTDGNINWQSNRVGSLAAHWLDVDSGLNRVAARFSTDSGATYADDFANLVLPAGQVPFFELLPGANTIRYNDNATPTATIVSTFYDSFD